MRKLVGTTRLVSALALFGLSTAHAGGVALIEIGASGMGTSYAGAAAVSNDTSTVWFNPAGMLELDNAEFALAAHLIASKTKFNDKGTTLNPLFDSTQIEGTESIDAGGNTFVPNIFYVRPLKKDLAFGFGISAPFGSSTEYNREWVGRYQAVKSGVSVIDINPSLAYRLNEKVNLGGGISIQFMEATLGNSFDASVSCVGLALQGQLDRAQCEAAGLDTAGNRETDGYAEVEGDSVNYTFNLGLLFKPQAATRLGIAYRHSVDHDLDVDAEFETNADLQATLDANSIPLFRNGKASALANLPASLMFSGAHKFNDRIELLADATWTQWSVFEELRIKFDNPIQPDSFNTQAWEDVWRVSAGVNYRQNNKLTLKAGLAYDQDPVPSPQRRTGRIPGNDRTWISVGANYAINRSISFDFGFAHLSVDQTAIDNASESAGGTTLRGTYDVSVNLLSAQFNWHLN